MRIAAPSISSPSPSRRKGATAATAGFSTLVETESVQAPAATQAPVAPTHVGALLSLQQDDERGARERTIKRGTSLLEALEEIRRSLLLGDLPPARLNAIAAQLKAQRHDCPDPALAEIIQDIELRVMVELAKRGLPCPC